MTRLVCLCLLWAMLGCASAEPMQADRDACLAAGHPPGTEAFEACLSDLLARRFERPAGQQVDDLRTRMWPR